MTLSSPPFCMDGTSNVDAQLVRQALGCLVSPNAGVLAWGDFLTTAQSVPNMSVYVEPGRGFIPGTSLPQITPGSLVPYWPQGSYFVESDVGFSLAISAADPSNPRVDTVILQVRDQAYAGSNKDAQPVVLIGSPTAGVTVVPTSPGAAAADGAASVPDSSIVLAYVLVGAGATSIVSGDVAYVAPVASSGMPPRLAPGVTTANVTAQVGQLIETSSSASSLVTVTLPAPAAGGMVAVFNHSAFGTGIVPSGGLIYGVGADGLSEVSLGSVGAGMLLMSDGANWLIIAGQQDSGWQACTLENGATGAMYARLQGDMVNMRGSVTGPVSGGTAFATLPVNLRPLATRQLSINVPDNTFTVHPDILVPDTDGSVRLTVQPISGTWAISLDGFSFAVQ